MTSPQARFTLEACHSTTRLVSTWCELSGYSREEMLAMRAGDLTVEAEVSGPELFERILQDGELVAEGVARRKGGSLVPLKFRASRRRVGGGFLILVAVWPR